ncbi:hypothetical protein [Spirochaeta dissipatitropha]
MSKKVRGWVFIFPLLHLVFIALLLQWHFQNTDIFGHISDQLSLTGTLQVSSGGTSGISQLQVAYEGLHFPLTHRAGVRVIDQNQETRNLKVTGYNTLDDGITVLFSEGLSIQFLTGDSSELRIIPVIPETLQPILELIIPMELQSGSSVQQTDNMSVISVDTGDDVFLLTLPARAVLNSDRGILTLPGTIGRQTIRYIKTERVAAVSEDDTELEVLPWYESETIRMSQAVFSEQLESYINTAYRGWSSTRYNAGTSTWQRPNSSPEFTEEAMVAYLSESWKRNDYTAAFNAMRTAATRHPEQITYASSLFLGDLRNKRLEMENADNSRSSELLGGVSARDSRLLRDHQFVEWVLLRGSTELYSALPGYLTDIRIDSLSSAGLVGLLENSLTETPLPEPIRTPLISRQQPAADMLIEKLVRIDDRIYLEAAAGQIDAALSIRAGMALQRLGQLRDDEQITGIGRTMVTSILAESDGLGFIPELLLLSGGSIVGREGSRSPESLYAYIHNNPSYPKMISLYNELGQGSFIYTIADISGISYSDERLSFQVNSPRQRTHYIYVYGLPQYRTLNLFGLQWPGDPNFESYSRGTFYHAAANTALIKFFQDAVSSEIIYNF